MTKKKELKHEFIKILNEQCPSDLDNHLDEVYPGIFIGDEFSAKSIETLGEHGITHILNAAYVGSRLRTQDWYDERNYKCTFKGLKALDAPRFNLGKYFEEAAEFIDSALSSNGKILVHCYVGMSRSATFVITYLMIKKQMRARDAITLIRQKRACHPNVGFVDQIIDLELKLQGLK